MNESQSLIVIFGLIFIVGLYPAALVWLALQEMFLAHLLKRRVLELTKLNQDVLALTQRAEYSRRLVAELEKDL